jgi:hypothetical protein
VVSKVAKPPYRSYEASAFQSGALRGHLQGGFASFITTPLPLLERRGISPQFQFIHNFYDRASFVDWLIVGKARGHRPRLQKTLSRETSISRRELAWRVRDAVS